jgi:hypothetical protein
LFKRESEEGYEVRSSTISRYRSLGLIVLGLSGQDIPSGRAYRIEAAIRVFGYAAAVKIICHF